MSTKEKELKEFTAAAISVTPRASETVSYTHLRAHET